MGKGDKKTKKGKRSMGSYGVSRKRSVSTPVAVAKPKAKKKAAPKTDAKPTEKKETVKKVAAKKTAGKRINTSSRFEFRNGIFFDKLLNQY
ncbi:MAG: 30S ribosomal protein THX [Flavobacteriales bacterium]